LCYDGCRETFLSQFFDDIEHLVSVSIVIFLRRKALGYG
jgi:hypothetical protein